MARHRRTRQLRYELHQLRLVALNRWHYFTKPRIKRIFLNHSSAPLKCRSVITDWLRLFDRKAPK